jgi:hypothetical protein
MKRIYHQLAPTMTALALLASACAASAPSSQPPALARKIEVPDPMPAEDDVIRKGLLDLFKPEAGFAPSGTTKQTQNLLFDTLGAKEKTPGAPQVLVNSSLCNSRGCSVDVRYDDKDVFASHITKAQLPKTGLLDQGRGAGRTALLKTKQGQLLATWFLLNPSPKFDEKRSLQ